MEELISHKKKGIEKNYITERSDSVFVEEHYNHFHFCIQEVKDLHRKASLILTLSQAKDIYHKLNFLIKRIEQRKQ